MFLEVNIFKIIFFIKTNAFFLYYLKAQQNIYYSHAIICFRIKLISNQLLLKVIVPFKRFLELFELQISSETIIGNLS